MCVSVRWCLLQKLKPIIISDSHDLILRFNHGPTKGFEEDVGTKTTFRIVNSQILAKPRFDFLNNPLYKNVELLTWDPSKYRASLHEVYMLEKSSKVFSIIQKGTEVTSWAGIEPMKKVDAKMPSLVLKAGRDKNIVGRLCCLLLCT